jgi:hypothetical protein
MPANPQKLLTDYPSFCLEANEDTTSEDASEELATAIVAFHDNYMLGIPLIGAGIITGLQQSAIKQALLADFTAIEAKESGLPLLPTDWTTTATAITTGILSMVVNTAIPHPPATVSTVGWIITSGGISATLQTSIALAMSQLSPILTGTMLVTALTANASTVSGIYTGMMPAGPSMAPFTTPWVGLY